VRKSTTIITISEFGTTSKIVGLSISVSLARPLSQRLSACPSDHSRHFSFAYGDRLSS